MPLLATTNVINYVQRNLEQTIITRWLSKKLKKTYAASQQKTNNLIQFRKEVLMLFYCCLEVCSTSIVVHSLSLSIFSLSLSFYLSFFYIFICPSVSVVFNLLCKCPLLSFYTPLLLKHFGNKHVIKGIFLSSFLFPLFMVSSVWNLDFVLSHILIFFRKSDRSNTIFPHESLWDVFLFHLFGFSKKKDELL